MLGPEMNLDGRDGAGAHVSPEHVEGLEFRLGQVAATMPTTSRESYLDGLELLACQEIRVLSLAAVGLSLECGD